MAPLSLGSLAVRFLGAALVGIVASRLTDRITMSRALWLAAGVTLGLAVGQLLG